MTHLNNIPTLVLDDEQIQYFMQSGCFITDEQGTVHGFVKNTDSEQQLAEHEFLERAQQARAVIHLLEVFITQTNEDLDLNELAREGLGTLLRDQQLRLEPS